MIETRGVEGVPDPGGSPAVEACWNEIGVRGDRSCALLAEHTHCRNCPTHAAAASRLLDRPIPPEYVAEWTAHYAEPARLGTAATASVVVFRLGAEWLALPTAVFDEAAEARPVHSLPRRRAGPAAGLVSVRGDLVVHVSLAGLVGVADAAAGEIPGAVRPREDGGGAAAARAVPRLLVVRDRRGRLAFTVDEVAGVFHFDPAELRPVPATLARSAAAFTTAILERDGRSIGCLDAERVVGAMSASLA